MNRRTILGRLLGSSVAMGLELSSASNRIEVGGSTLDVSIDSEQFELGRTALLDWVTRSPKPLRLITAGSRSHTLACTSSFRNTAVFRME